MSDKNLGFGVMVGMLSGNDESAKTYQKAVGKVISAARLEGDVLHLEFTDGLKIRIADEGQSCCEHRYMTTDDDLSQFVGAELVSMELRDAPPVVAKYDEHEVQFLVVKTTRGYFTMSTHNEHNGYYGGFWIQLSEE